MGLEIFNYDCPGQLSFIEPDFIKDADCTVRTPVIRGIKDSPVYGQGKSIKPRLPGRTGSQHFKQIYLPELLPLEEYDLIVVLFSGGTVKRIRLSDEIPC